MSASPTEAFYLTAGREPVHALFDSARAPASSTGVLLCPLFGNEDLCAYRARREWARTLAGAGHHTLRIDLPSTGDSAGGPNDPGRLEAWTDALATAAAWLREQPGCERVSAIGIELGGLLCYRAAAEEAAIDDLALWSVPSRGRTFLRQLRVLAQMQASSATAASTEVAELPEGALASAGFLLSEETVSELEALDLATLSLPRSSERRVLLLDRDGLEVDARLRAALEDSGAEVTLAAGSGYGRMVAPPQQSQPPIKVFATVSAWLAAGDERAAAAAPPPAASRTSAALELTIGGAHVRETPLSIRCSEGRLMGVLTEPEGQARLCAVLLNSGALRHIGQNRMWVETARRWAARGVATVRVDLVGIGDSDGDASALEQDEGLYIDRYVSQTQEVLDELAARGLPERFLLAGLCSGAYWSLHAALEDERVCGAFMVNPRVLFWDRSIGGLRDARNAHKALRAGTWRKLLRGQITAQRASTIARGVLVALGSLPGRANAARRARKAGGDPLGRALDVLQERDTQLLGVFTAAEPLLEEMRRAGSLARMRERPNVRVVEIPGPLTSHTLEPLRLQRDVNEILDAALDRVHAPHDAAGREPARAAEPSGQGGRL